MASLFLILPMTDHSCRLYLITPPRIDIQTFAVVYTAALDAGDIACVQLRLKDCSDDDVRRAAEALMPPAQDRDIAFLINDRADLAAELGADGVHIGQDDGSYDEARGLVGKDAIVGVTCHNSRHLAMEAGEAGADYVAFGAFFPTETKTVQHHADIETLQWWSDFMTVPSVVIGGITAENCPPLVEAGADFLAVSGCIWNNSVTPAEAVTAFQSLLDT